MTATQDLDLTLIPPDFYSQAFQSIPPRRAHNTIVGRLKAAKAFNEELADYFKERNAIEDIYIKALLKLSKKPIGIFQASSTSTTEDEEILGGIAKIKDLLQRELIDLMDSHSKFQSKLNTEVESAFRNCPILGQSNWVKVRSLEDNLNVTIKNYEDLEVKLNKSKSKLNGTTNVKKLQTLQLRFTEDQNNFNQAKQSYLDQAPMIYQSYQSFDSTRLTNLIETLTKFETLQADHTRDKMEVFERSMMNLLAFDNREDMQRFAMKNGNIAQTLVAAAGGSRPPSVNPTNPESTAATPPGSQAHQAPSNFSTPHTIRRTASNNGPHDSASDPSNLDQNPNTIQSQSSPSAPLQSSTRHQLSASTSTYDPNHASIPILNTPNISVPIRSNPIDAPGPRSDGLPPRDLYVQRQASIKGSSRIHRSESANNISRFNSPSSTSVNQMAKSSASHSIADKIFNRSRFTNILSRSSGHGAGSSQLHDSNALHPSRTSTSDVYQGGQMESLPPERHSHARSSSMANVNSMPDQLNHINDTEDLQSNLKPNPNGNQNTSNLLSHRFSQLSSTFTPSNIMAKRKSSRSAPTKPQHIPNEDAPPLPTAPRQPHVDADGFTIPPADRDRKPWENTASQGAVEMLDENAPGPNQDGGGLYKNEDTDRSNPGLAGMSQFAIKPRTSHEDAETEAERLAAIQKVQNSLANAGGGNVLGGVKIGGLGPTRRSTTGLRGRRADGRGMTMYDTSTPPLPGTANLTRSSSTITRGKGTDEMPLSAIRAAKLLKQQQEGTGASIQELLRQTELASSQTVGNNNTSRFNLDNQGQSHLVMEPERLSQSNFDALVRGEEITGDIDKVRTGSVVSSMSNATTGYGFLNSQGFGASGTNPFLNRSFSPPFNSPTSTGPMNHLGSSLNPRPMAAPGLTAIVRETLNVLMDQGEVTKVLVLGEVRFVWASLAEEIKKRTDEQVRFTIQHYDRLEKVVCATPAVTPGGGPGEYVLDLQKFQDEQAGQAVEADAQPLSGMTVLKYRIYFDAKQASTQMDIASRYVPIRVSARWRAQKARTELMLTYEPNPAFHHFTPTGEETSWKLDQLGFSTMIYNPDGQLTNPRHTVRKTIEEHQEVPSGEWDPKTNEIKWSVGQLQAEAGLQRIIGRFIHPATDDNNQEDELESAHFVRANCGPVQVRWKMSGTSLSGIELKVSNDAQDQLQNQSNVQRFEDVVKVAVAGTFLAR